MYENNDETIVFKQNIRSMLSSIDSIELKIVLLSFENKTKAIINIRSSIP